MGDWEKVSASEPCPICESRDWCTRTTDGKAVKCMRVESRKEVKSGGWIHHLEKPLPPKPKKRRKKKRPPPNFGELVGKMAVRKKAAAIREVESQRLGIPVGCLERLRVGWGWDSWRKVEFSSWGERAADGSYTGISRRYSDGAKRTMEGSQHGLFYEDFWYLPAGPLFLVEGGSDTASLMAIGAAVLGRFSNRGGSDIIASMLRARGWTRPVIVVGERDEKPDRRGTRGSCRPDCRGCALCYPGLWGARRTAQQLAKEFRRSKIQEEIFWCLSPDGSKDARAWCNERPDALVIDWVMAVRETLKRQEGGRYRC